MASHPQPELSRWRRVQLARHLVEVEGCGLGHFSFDDEGAISKLRLDRGVVDDIVAQGVAFMTNGCPGGDGAPGCTRPYGSYRPVEAFRDYPFVPEANDLEEVGQQLRLDDLVGRPHRKVV